MTRPTFTVDTIASAILCALLLLTSGSAHEVTANADWRERFNEVYRLENAEVMRRVAPPFIPERERYYLEARPHKKKPPNYITFRWNGGLHYRGEGTSGNQPLNQVLTQTLGLARFAFEGPDDLLELGMPGDWILRKDASQENKLRALEKILKDNFGKNIRFISQQVDREAVVARGNFSFNPPTGTYDDSRVHIYSDILLDQGTGLGNSNLGEFLQKVGDWLNFPVVDETREEGNGVRVQWALHRDAHYATMAEDRMDKVNKVLANLARQTSLELTIERRSFNVWFVADEKAATKRAKEAGVEVLPLPKVGAPYEFVLTTVEGQVVDSKTFRGKVLLIDCWSTGCWSCIAKMPKMKELYAKWHSRDLEIIGVNFDNNERTMKEAVKSLSLPWLQILVPIEPFHRDLWQTATGISTIPRCLIVDRQGILRADCSPKELEQELTRLIGLETRKSQPAKKSKGI